MGKLYLPLHWTLVRCDVINALIYWLVSVAGLDYSATHQETSRGCWAGTLTTMRGRRRTWLVMAKRVVLHTSKGDYIGQTIGR